MWKKADVILAAVLVVLGCLGVFFLGNNQGNRQVVVKRGNEILYKGSVLEDKTLKIGGDYDNVVKIEGGRVFFAASTCPNQDCVNMGSLGESGGTLACAPNGVVVTLQGSEVDMIAG